jgi:hypothetical protein
MRKITAALAFAFLTAAAAVRGAGTPDAAELARMAARLAPTPMRVDLGHLSAGDRRAVIRLIAASRIVNDIFLDQMWSGNRALWRRLEADRSPLGRRTSLRRSSTVRISTRRT